MTKSCTRPHRAPIGAAASSRAVAAAMTLARDCGRGSRCGHEMRLPAHAPPWPIVGRSSQGRGARRSRAHRLWARRFLKGPNGPAPQRAGPGPGRGSGRGSALLGTQPGRWRAPNSRPLSPGDGRRGGHLAGWGRGAVRTLGEANEKSRPGTRGGAVGHMRTWGGWRPWRGHPEREEGSGAGAGLGR